jgi:acyl-CoA synthetase (AMP-forming)/AMP-acid ligase II
VVANNNDTPMEQVVCDHFSGAGAVAVLDDADPVAAFRSVARGDGRLALPTSGTSGRARTIIRTARSWTDSFPAVSRLTALTVDSQVWLPGPLTATMNLFAAVHADWAGASLVDSPADATHLHLTPARLDALLSTDVRLAGRMVVVAGDALEPDLRRRAEAAGATIAHYYGAAELSFVAWGSDRMSLRRFPGVDIDVREGEIWVRSPYLASGYAGGAGVAGGPLRRDERGFATVGDRGGLVADQHHAAGRLLVHGRPDSVTTGGATVSLADVEAALRAPGLRGQVAVIGLPHLRLGQIVAAVLTDSADREPARTAAAELGAGRPRRWFVRTTLPVTAAGKVDRASLVAELTNELTDATDDS